MMGRNTGKSRKKVVSSSPTPRRNLETARKDLQNQEVARQAELQKREEEKRKKLEEQIAAQKRQEEEEVRRAADEAKRKAAEERERRRNEELLRKKEEEERKKREAEEAERRRVEEERRKQLETARKKKLQEERQRKVEEARLRLEAEEKERERQEEEKKKQLEAEALAKKQEEAAKERHSKDSQVRKKEDSNDFDLLTGYLSSDESDDNEDDNSTDEHDTSTRGTRNIEFKTHKKLPQRGDIDRQVDIVLDNMEYEVPIVKLGRNDGVYMFGRRTMRCVNHNAHLFAMSGSKKMEVIDYIKQYERVEKIRLRGLQSAAMACNWMNSSLQSPKTANVEV